MKRKVNKQEVDKHQHTTKWSTANYFKLYVCATARRYGIESRSSQPCTTFNSLSSITWYRLRLCWGSLPEFRYSRYRSLCRCTARKASINTQIVGWHMPSSQYNLRWAASAKLLVLSSPRKVRICWFHIGIFQLHLINKIN